MPNVSHNLEPRFEGGIDAKIVHSTVTEVSKDGYANIKKEYSHHLVAWVSFEDGGSLRTTSYNQQKKKQTQSYVQTEGGINIGTEEWADRRVAILVLDKTLEYEP